MYQVHTNTLCQILFLFKQESKHSLHYLIQPDHLLVLISSHLSPARNTQLVPQVIDLVPGALRNVHVVVAGLAQDALLAVLAQALQGKWDVDGVNSDLGENFTNLS